VTPVASRNAKLTLSDISDVRAYERERDTLRAEMIELKTRRRVHVGTIMSFNFENRMTMRFQIQEMARVEKLVTDEGIQAELDVYNPLIPEPGHLSATLFIECTTAEQMREWFPKLVGIERRVELRIGDADDLLVVPSVPDAAHEAQLTREEMTAAVHYLGFDVGIENVERFRRGPVRLAVTHPSYLEETQLSDQVREDLALDLAG
jgi:Protein of unknown function (DUF3501)